MQEWLGGFVRRHLSDPFFSNSIYLILSSMVSSGIGLFFWLFAAKYCPKEDVGIATALLSATSLIVLISRLGFEQSTIRFFPNGEKDRILGTTAIVTTAFAILFGIIFIVAIDSLAPDLSIVKQYSLLFLGVVAFASLANIMGNAFIALRKSRLYFFQNVLTGSRFLFLIPLAVFGTIGIFSSAGLAYFLAFCASIAILIRLGIRPKGMDIDFLRASLSYSTANYVSQLLMFAPNSILPILVLNLLGPGETAHYYIAFSLASVVFMVPNSLGTSLFVEGSHGQSLRKTAIKSIVGSIAILVPAIVLIYLLGGLLLGIVGNDYAASGLSLLQALVLSSFFIAIFQVFISIKRVQRDIRAIIVFAAVLFALLIGLSYIFAQSYGLVGIGYAWICGYAVANLVIALWIWAESKTESRYKLGGILADRGQELKQDDKPESVGLRNI